MKKHILTACILCALSAPALAEPAKLSQQSLDNVRAGLTLPVININVSPQITTAITTQVANAVAVLGGQAAALNQILMDRFGSMRARR